MSKLNGEIAVLVVHGIGAHKPEENLNKLLSGLRKVQPDNIPENYQQGDVLTLDQQPVRFYEVYWADLLLGEKIRGSFQMQEVLSLAWFPWFNYRRSNYPKGSYPLLKILGWSLFLPIMNLFILLAYHGASIFGHGFSKHRHKNSDHKPGGGKSAKDTVTQAAQRAQDYSKFDAIMDDFLGDIFNYINSANNAFYRDKKEPPVADSIKRVYPEIIQRFYQQLLRAQTDGCEGIQVVAHSLGTVVSFHALSGLLLDWDDQQEQSQIMVARSKVKHLYTIGSPLEKIRFFWPLTVIKDSPLGDMKIKWDNFVSFFDPVAGVLKRYGQWGKINNYRLLGGGFIRGHVVYEHSPVFIRELTIGLCGQPIVVRRTFRERWLDRLVLIGETLLAPVAVLIALLMGLGVFWMAIQIFPYLLSLLLRLFLPDDTWTAITSGFSYFMTVLYILVFTIGPYQRAKQVHGMFWRRKQTDAVNESGH